MHEARTSDFVFPGQKLDKPLSVMALEMVVLAQKCYLAGIRAADDRGYSWASQCIGSACDRYEMNGDSGQRCM
jgi:hypothetical protein